MLLTHHCDTAVKHLNNLNALLQCRNGVLEFNSKKTTMEIILTFAITPTVIGSRGCHHLHRGLSSKGKLRWQIWYTYPVCIQCVKYYTNSEKNTMERILSFATTLVCLR